MNTQISILVADQHRLVRESLVIMLEKSEFIGKIYQASDPPEAIQILKENDVNVILLDTMTQGHCFQVIEFIQRKRAKTKIIVLTDFDGEAIILNLLGAGVPAILSKRTTHKREIEQAIHSVMEGHKFYYEVVQKTLDASPEQLKNAPKIKLSKRESETLRLLCRGNSTRLIAEELSLSEHTVDGYRKNILRKTNTKNTNELIAYSFMNGVVAEGVLQ